MPKDKNSGKKLADMLYGNPEGAAFGVYPQAGKRGQRIPSAKEQLAKIMADERAMEMPQFGEVDLSVPSASNRAMGQRMVQRDVDLKRQSDQDMSPLEKVAGGMQAGRLMGSGMYQAVKSIPTAITKGSKAAEDYIAENIYQPTQPKAYEYAGDVADFLSSLETDYKIPPVLPEAVALQYLAGPAKQQAGRVAKDAAKQGALNLAAPRTLNPQAGVIKMKGGNWLGGSVESGLKPLKRQTAGRSDPAEMLSRMRERYTPEEIAKLQEGASRTHVLESIADLEKDVAFNNWVDRNLGNYVKKEMATPEDPVRRLAEEGIVHIPSEQVGVNRYRAPKHREAYGGEQLGKSEAARAWEDASDVAINAPTARTVGTNESLYQANPWIEKLSPEDRVYALNRPASTQHEISGLGFDHILDVLSEDLASGRIRPEQLNKVSMEQAVRRTFEYDQEMAKRMRETALKQQEGFPLHKEYPEGYRWIELTAPKEDAKRLSEIDTLLNANRQGGEYGVDWLRGANGEKEYFVTRGSGRNTVYMDKFPTEEEAIARGRELSGQQIDADALMAEREGLTKEAREKMLADALKYEGDTMGHCVGGYCPDVLEGKSRIYSLRDAKGEPHVTVEVEPNQHLDYNQWYGEQPTSYKALLNAKRSEPGYDPYQEPAYLAARDALPPKIVQIKGKQNAAPKEAYLPYVQDFVKSGQWADVGDLGNTGLYKADPGELGMFIPSDPRLKNLPGRRTEDFEKAKQAGLFGDQKYLTRNEWEDILRKQIESESGPLPPLPEEGMAGGGRVHFSDNPDTMMLELAAGGGVKTLAAMAKGAQNALPAVDRQANLAKFLEPSKVPQRLYHGTTTTEGGKGQEAFRRIKPSKEGSLGSGVYLTPDSSRASGYAESPWDSKLNLDKHSPNVLPVHAQMRNPLILEGKGDPMIEALTKLGMDADSASRMVERAYEQKGYIGKQVQQRAQAAGYDGLLQYRDGDLSEVVSYNPNAVKSAIGNQGTYDINDPDLSKAAGGAIRMGGGGALGKLSAKGAKATMKASEALGRIEGRPLVITQADRTKVGGGFLGGPGFSGLQLEDPAYRAAEAAWAVKNPGTAKMILGGGREAGGDPVYAAMLGTPTQHQSNQMVFDKLYGDFKKAAKRGELEPELRDRINLRLANTVDKDGNPIFPPDVDILDKNFKNLASTFDRRSVTANLIGGMGVGGKKGQIIDYDKVIRQTTDPALVDAPTGALGNRLFTLSGGIIDRPDLHPAFPTILQGEDLGVNFDPVARDLIMKDYIERTMREKGRAPGIFDYTRGYPPSQLITEDILTELQKMGKKAGGAVRKAAGGEITADDLILEERKL